MKPLSVVPHTCGQRKRCERLGCHRVAVSARAKFCAVCRNDLNILAGRKRMGSDTTFQKEGADILAAERVVQRTETAGRRPRSDLTGELLRHLARMTAVARRYHLEAAEHVREYGDLPGVGD